MKSLKLALAVLACAATIDGAALANGASYLSQDSATRAAMRYARTFETYNNTNSVGFTLSAPRALCGHGRDSATMFTCAVGWVMDDGSGDTIWAISAVHVTLTSTGIHARAFGRPCVEDRTTGINSSGC